ncbi:MAG TPA: methionine--tRNA ligase, partial [Chloroflexota bacterium]
MSEHIFIGVAWPYANGPLHLGHLAGALLPPDIFARYNRIKGNQVLMVSGSDQHGTPITVRAEREGKSPREVADFYHEQFVDTLNRVGISYDLYTKTTTENHYQVTQDLFLGLLKNGYLEKKEMLSPFCVAEQRFLPDRYVEGTCPICGYTDARGDQCDNCGHQLDPVELINPRCKFDGSTPEIRPTEHFFLMLTKLNQPLLEWAKPKTYWRPNVYNFTINMLEEGLKDRPITRDIEWGVPIPLPGYENKRIYVWFDAVTGYLSAAKEWAKNIGEPEKWREWWQEPCRAYYFIGKDNIPFHAVIWPAMLMGYGGLNLPYDVPANEYLNLEGRQFSTSRNWAAWLPDMLAQFDPDPIRYTLTINMPETRDTDFSMSEFVRRNNDELVATYGNLVHRTLSFVGRYFDGKAPVVEEGYQGDERVIARIAETFESVGGMLEVCKFKDSLKEVMNLAQFGNRYFEEKAPWKSRKEDPAACARTIYECLRIVDSLKVLTYPYLPFSAVKLHRLLGYDDDLVSRGWGPSVPPQGAVLPEP